MQKVRPVCAMMQYTTRDVAQLLDLSSSKIRSFARAGLTTSVRDRRGKYRFLFQDLILLRTAKELSQAAIHPCKIYRALRTLKEQLPMGAPLSAVRIVVARDEVLIQDQRTVWHSETGQAQLGFSVGEMANQIAQLIRGVAQEAEQTSDTSGDEWFELGLNFETAGATEDAKAAYARVLELNPAYVCVHINHGRLFQEEGRSADAGAHYRAALVLDPENATAAFNLATVLEELGRKHGAIEAYLKALKADASLADAHHNLSGIYEDMGNRTAALRHLIRYTALR